MSLDDQCHSYRRLLLLLLTPQHTITLRPVFRAPTRLKVMVLEDGLCEVVEILPNIRTKVRPIDVHERVCSGMHQVFW